MAASTTSPKEAATASNGKTTTPCAIRLATNGADTRNSCPSSSAGGRTPTPTGNGLAPRPPYDRPVSPHANTSVTTPVAVVVPTAAPRTPMPAPNTSPTLSATLSAAPAARTAIGVTVSPTPAYVREATRLIPSKTSPGATITRYAAPSRVASAPPPTSSTNGAAATT